MVISRLQLCTSSILRPKVSLPNTKATCCPACAACNNSGTNSRGVCSGEVSSRLRLVSAQLKVVSASASASVAEICAFSNTSAAPEANTKLSCGSLNACGQAASKSDGSGVIGVAINCGATRVSRLKPMVFMARAAAPILAGWLVRESTMRIWFK